MKNLIRITAIATIFLLSVCFSFGQTKADTICAERGHVFNGVGWSAAAYCPEYTIDTDTTTITVYPACNSYTSTCGRCGMQITTHGEERRIVTWRKKNY